MALPVHEAARRNDVEALQGLLDADPGLVEAEDRSLRCGPLYHACKEGCVEAARRLLDRGAGIDKSDRDGVTPLMAACSRGHVEVVSMLLARGADPSLRDRMGFTALTWASFGRDRPGSDHVAVLRRLIKDGRVLVNARSSFGWTALLSACENGYTERARVLLVEGGADHTIADDRYADTPMAAARRKGHLDCVWVLEALILTTNPWVACIGNKVDLEKGFLLSKARAVVTGSECISKAAEKARTQAEAQAAREEAAPAHLCGRVRRRESLPVLEMVEQEGEERLRVVFEYVMMRLTDDLFVELMEVSWFR